MWEMVLQSLPEIDQLYATMFHRTHDLHWSVVQLVSNGTDIVAAESKCFLPADVECRSR